ncbi:hypothetical protein [Streptomyces eurythermus]
MSPHSALDGAWGSPERTGFLNTSDTEWEEMIASKLTSHLQALGALTPGAIVGPTRNVPRRTA